MYYYKISIDRHADVCYTEPVITVKRYTHLQPFLTIPSSRMLTKNAESYHFKRNQ